MKDFHDIVVLVTFLSWAKVNKAVVGPHSSLLMDQKICVCPFVCLIWLMINTIMPPQFERSLYNLLTSSEIRIGFFKYQHESAICLRIHIIAESMFISFSQALPSNDICFIIRDALNMSNVKSLNTKKDKCLITKSNGWWLSDLALRAALLTNYIASNHSAYSKGRWLKNIKLYK